MLTLRDLTEQATIQGDIRISKWDGDDETALMERKMCDDFHVNRDTEKFSDMEVAYIFASPDGFLHIELCES